MWPDQAFTSDVARTKLSVPMDIDWHIGDVIFKLRRRRRMNQTALAEKVGVNKATIVRAEDGDPKVSRDTYIKIARTLGTNLAALEVEAARLESGARMVEHPTAIRETDVSRSHTRSAEPSRSALKRDGSSLAGSSVPHDQGDPLSATTHPSGRELRDYIDREARAIEHANPGGVPTRTTRATRKPPATAHTKTARSGARDRKHRR